MAKKSSNQEQNFKVAIQAVIKGMMDRVLEKVLVEDPFIPDEHRANRPLYAALVPDEISRALILKEGS